MKLNKLSLNTIGLNRIGLNRIGSTSVGSSAIDRPYISPDVLSSLAGVWIADGKSNTDPDRNIIKNKLPGRGGDFEIFNAAYEGMSGCNGYPVVFGANKTWEHFSGTANYTSDTTSTTIHITHVRLANRGLLYSYVKENGVLTNIREIPAFRVTVKGLEGNSKLVYKYLATKDATKETSLHLSNGTHKLAKSFVPTDALLDLTTNVWIGMFISPISEEVTEFDCDITIEVLPEYEGSFVTDGVNDMIVSQNPVSEMLGGSNELTVVSMIHQISPVPDSYGFTNYIREGSIWSRTNVKTSGKTGIYGYKISKGNTEVGASNLINNILGDKADYEAMGYNITNYSDINYSVAGYIKDGSPTEVSSVAWYWTFIAKRVLTTDEINQVIAYYNLDKYVKPDIYYNVKKQGLTNDTPDEDWYLKDFSGNGRDMTLYNYARTPESGINEEGGLQSDGVDDYGQFVGDLGLKDYTVAVDRAYQDENVNCVPFISSVGRTGGAPFLMEMVHPTSHVTYPYSFGTPTESVVLNSSRQISYQSTYVYNRNSIARGNSVKTGDGLTIGSNEGVSQYSKLCLWSFLLFPYTLSEFLLERQLKKHKLGTLYPGMVEFRPIISGRTDLIKEIKWYSDSWSKRIYVGDYIPKGVDVTANILLNDNTSELVKATYGNNYTEVRKQANWSETNNEWDLIIHNIGKSPQKIGITIDEYIRFEDIVQPYPAKFRFTDVDSGQVYDWGSKIKVGSTIKILSNVDIGNYLSDIYTITGYKYNGNIYSYNELNKLTFEVTNSPLEFASRKTYKLGGYEPKVILYPERLKLSNDTYKLLGYIPDLTGNGNHGVFNNLAFTEESGVNEDGSVHLDGVDDYISIPTLSKGGKQVLMKVNWQKQDTMLYNQNPGQDNFAIFTNDYNNNNLVVAYASRNNGNTYIDGVVNNNILATQLKGITHNIVATNNNIDATITPIIGSNKNHDNFFAQMALYSFMLFDEISTDEEIKDLNDIVGIVSKVELPPYYWDTYGKTNTDADRDEIVNLASDEVSIQYPTDFTDTSVWEDMGAVTSSTILTLTTWAMGGDTGIGNTIKAKVATPAMKVKFITDGNGYLDYMYSGYNTLELPRDAGEYEVELPASTIVDGWGARFSGSGNGSFIIELLGNEVRSGTLKVINSAYDEDSGYKNNGIALDGVDDSLVNTDIPAFTDYTYIFKRDILGFNPSSVSMHKGSSISNGRAFMSDYDYSYGETKKVLSYSFGNNLDTPDAVSKKIIYGTRTSVDGQPITPGGAVDDAGLTLGKWYDDSFKNMVFYKLMLYPKTIDILSINMLKNLFERDEIIDLNNPIFKK
ncbi:hypothetical protein [Bacteroides caccae]|uniref:hypothetical protein n=1 Tax=Bacteroides caccae TaxID=47678 RepID=UPI00189E1F32|nr:hypothetical protein [Bacteroides caccae]